MKSLKKLCACAVLTLALTLTAFAGQIPCGVTDTPPPTSAQTGNEPTEANAISDSVVVDVVLMILENVLP